VPARANPKEELKEGAFGQATKPSGKKQAFGQKQAVWQLLSLRTSPRPSQCVVGVVCLLSVVWWVCFLGLVVVVVVVLAAGLGLFLGCCVVIFGKSKSSDAPTL